MKTKALILPLVFLVSACALTFGASYARADDAAVAAGSTVIDLGGDVVTSGMTGGMADPVPLFSGDNGPAVFVMGGDPTLSSDPLEEQMTNTVKQGFKPSTRLNPYGPPN